MFDNNDNAWLWIAVPVLALIGLVYLVATIFVAFFYIVDNVI